MKRINSYVYQDGNIFFPEKIHEQSNVSDNVFLVINNTFGIGYYNYDTKIWTLKDYSSNITEHKVGDGFIMWIYPIL